MANRFEDGSFDLQLKSHIRFELKSFIGRFFSPRHREPTYKRLHLGCGGNIISGLENVDFFVMKFWTSRHVGHDFRYPLPYADQAFVGAFCEHTLEHLYPRDAINFLREVHRVLAPGSTFRVVVPDIKLYVDYYIGKNNINDFIKFRNGCEAIWSVTQNFGHLSCWDSDMLIYQLMNAGFSQAYVSDFKSGKDEKLICDRDDRKWESLYVEAIA